MTFAINSINQFLFTPKQVFFCLQTLFEALFSFFLQWKMEKKSAMGGGGGGGRRLMAKVIRNFHVFFLTLAFSIREHVHSHRLSI